MKCNFACYRIALCKRLPLWMVLMFYFCSSWQSGSFVRTWAWYVMLCWLWFLEIWIFIEVVSFDFDEFDGVKSWHWLDDDCCHIIHLQIVTKKKENVSKCVYTNSVLFTIKPNENNKLQPNHNCVCQSHASENRPWNRTRCNQRKIGSWFSESKIGVISRDTFWKSWEQDDDGGMFHVLAGKWVIKSVQFVH